MLGELLDSAVCTLEQLPDGSSKLLLDCREGKWPSDSELLDMSAHMSEWPVACECVI